MRSNNPPLKITDVVQGMIACRSNARELLEEVDILLTYNRFARAYALLHTACEELAKFSILELTGKGLAQDNPPIWKRFWRRYRSHDSKIAQLNVQLLYLLAESEDIGHMDTVSSAEVLFGRGLTIRNSALYVDTAPNGEFRKPSDIEFEIAIPVLIPAAKLALSASNRRGQTSEEIDAWLRAAPSQSMKDNALKVFAEAIQRAKDAGLNEDSLCPAVKEKKS